MNGGKEINQLDDRCGGVANDVPVLQRKQLSLRTAAQESADGDELLLKRGLQKIPI